MNEHRTTIDTFTTDGTAPKAVRARCICGWTGTVFGVKGDLELARKRANSTSLDHLFDVATPIRRSR